LKQNLFKTKTNRIFGNIFKILLVPSIIIFLLYISLFSIGFNQFTNLNEQVKQNEIIKENTRFVNLLTDEKNQSINLLHNPANFNKSVLIEKRTSLDLFFSEHPKYKKNIYNYLIDFRKEIDNYESGDHTKIEDLFNDYIFFPSLQIVEHQQKLLLEKIPKKIEDKKYNLFILAFIFSLFGLFSFGLFMYFYFKTKEKIEDEIQESLLKEQIIHDNIIYSETDLKGNITFVSDKFCEISGYSEKELIGQPHNIVRHQDTPKEVFKDVWDTIQKGHTWYGTVKNKNKNGEPYYVLASIFPKYKNDQIIGFCSSREDFTPLYIEQNINTSIYEILNTVIVKFKHNDIFDFNKTFYELFDFKDLEDFKSKQTDFSNLFVNSEKNDYLKNINTDEDWINKVKLNPNEIIKIALKDKNEVIRYFNISYVKLPKDLSYIQEDIFVFSEITNLENQTNLLQEQTKFSTMGEMITMIAHQWRQPLASLAGLFLPMQIKMNMGMPIDPEDFDNKIKSQQETIKYLDNTIEDFLSFSKKDNFSTEVELSEICLKPFRLIENSLKKVEANINIEYKNCNPDDVILTNENKIDQVILNLYKNSLDEFLNKKDTIKNPEINIFIEETNDNFVFSISDNAGGIPFEILPKIFDAYYSTKSKNGTGIGLYMSKVIVEQHLEGSIKVRNIENGALFTISLPKFLI